jgi:type VI protein secretion system component VasK
MLDVHPPNEAAHTWKDFFIHVGTICVGLLIAIGLEQTVEFFHHRHQLQEVRAQLAEERELDARILNYDKAMDQQMDAELATDAELLRHRAAGDKTPLAGKLRYKWFGVALQDGAWQSAKQSSAISLMGESELAIYSYRYFDFASFMQSSLVLFPTLDEAAAIVHDTPGDDLSPGDTQELIRLTHHAQGQLSTSEEYLRLCIDFGLQTELPHYSILDKPPVRLDQLPD